MKLLIEPRFLIGIVISVAITVVVNMAIQNKNRK